MTTAERRPPRAHDAAATRADLMRAARRRFTLLGYERTTSRDIAADAGANVSLINRYFGSKEGLFEAVLRESTGTLDYQVAGSGAELAQGILGSLSPDAWPEYGHENPLLLMLRGFSSDAATNELRRQGLAEAVRSFADVLGARGPEEGGPGQEPSAEAVRQGGLLLALLVGVLTLRELLPDDPFGDPARLDLPGELRRLSEGLSAD